MRKYRPDAQSLPHGFQESHILEPLDLVETIFGKGPVVAPVDHAVDHLLLHRMDGAHLAESGHGAAQLVGFLGCEFCSLHGNAHRLFLKQRHALGLAENLLQFVRRSMLRRR